MLCIKKQSVKNKLKELTTLNNFINTYNDSGSYMISFYHEGKKVSANIMIESKDEINRLVNSSKERIKEEVLNTANEYRISFDSEDNEILGISDSISDGDGH